MTELIVVNDSNLDEILNGSKPVLLLISDGDGVRSDFLTEIKKVAKENPQYVVAQIDPKQNPVAAERFEIGSRPVMVAWACGEAKARRVRPWGTDAALAAEMLKEYIGVQAPGATEIEQAQAAQEPKAETEQAQTAQEPKPKKQENAIVHSKPVAVTDETFEEEIINSDLPVLIDFWAEWCGPCRMVAPILDKLAAEFAGQVKIAKVNVDENQGLAGTFRIMSIPTMMAVKQRTMVFNQAGALPEPALRDLIQQLIALEIPPQEEAEETAEPSGD